MKKIVITEMGSHDPRKFEVGFNFVGESDGTPPHRATGVPEFLDHRFRQR